MTKTSKKSEKKEKKEEIRSEPPVEVYGTLDTPVETAFARAMARYGKKDVKDFSLVFHKRNEQEARLVRRLASHGDTLNEIAVVLGLPDSIVKKFYKTELSEGQALAKAQVKKQIFDLCMDGNTDMLKLYAKTQLGWSETKKVEQKLDVTLLTKEQRDAMVRANDGYVIDTDGAPADA